MITYCETRETTGHSHANELRIKRRLNRRETIRRGDAVGAIKVLLGTLDRFDARSPQQRADGRKRVEHARASIHLLELYRETFPLEWARSQKSAFGQSDEYPAYTEREVEFMHLVDRQLCPVALDWLDGTDERYPFIPLWTAPEWDVVEDMDAADWPHAYQLAVALNRLDGGTLAWYREQHSLGAEDYEVTGSRDWDTYRKGVVQFSWQTFERACAATDTPLKHLPQAVAVTSHDTGNVLFDYAPEMEPPMFGWTSENIRYLTEAYVEYRRTCDDLTALSDWLEAKEAADDKRQALKRARILQAFRLYNIAHLPRGVTAEAVANLIIAEAKRLLYVESENRPAQQLSLFDGNP